MFTMMNNARLSVGLQGLAVAERAYQQALAYAVERRQGRAVGAPPGEQSPIVEHPDVRRMLMTQRAWIDAMRCLLYENAAAVDRAGGQHRSRRAAAVGGDRRPLHPAVEGAVHRRRQRDDVAGAAGPRRHGLRRGDRCRAALPRHPHRRHLRGHQRDPGRRPRRAQAVDAGRRRSCSRCSTPSAPTPTACPTCRNWLASVRTCRPRSAPPVPRPSTWRGTPRTDPNALLSASTPYLRLLGTVVCAGLLARAALAAGADAGGGADEAAFRHAKLVSARFFGEQILPTATGLLGAITAGSADLFAIAPAQLG